MAPRKLRAANRKSRPIQRTGRLDGLTSMVASTRRLSSWALRPARLASCRPPASSSCWSYASWSSWSFSSSSFAGAIASEAAGAAAAGTAGAVVSVWARAARGEKAIAAEIPSAANVFSIVQSPCELFVSLGCSGATACARQDELAMNVAWRELGAATGLTRRRTVPYVAPRSAMSHNTFGHLFRVTTFGESHGAGIGCVVEAVRREFRSKPPTSRPNSTGAGPAPRASPPSAKNRTRRASSPA